MNSDIFKWFNFIINAMRLFGKIFGSEQEQKEVRESEERTGDGNNLNAV